LVQLVNVYLSKPGFAESTVQGDLLKNLLGVFQKLLSSMNTDSMAMDLLRAIIDNIPWSVLSVFGTQIWAVLFTRAKTSLTDSFSQDLSSFIGYFTFTQGVAALVSSIESVQAGMFGMVLEKLVLDKTQNVLNPVARRNVALGLTKLVFDSDVLLNETLNRLIIPCVVAILDLVEKEDSSVGAASQGEALMKMQEGGFTNVFSKLRAGNVKVESKLKDVDAKNTVHQGVHALAAQRPDVLSTIQQSLPSNYQGIFRLYTS
jgi:exportin-2 (importin alpha re-exporter)